MRRRTLPLWGGAAGLLGALPTGLLAMPESPLAWALLGGHGLVVGTAVGVMAGVRPRRPTTTITSGLLAGLLGWLILRLTLAPLTRGDLPDWSAADAGAAYPDLVAGLIHGGLTGVAFQLLTYRSAARRGEPSTRPEHPPAPRVVIVGGGFAGVEAARRFERLALRGRPVDVTLVSDSNYLLFTPMLAGVASGALEAQHIGAPIRAALTHTRFRRGTVDRIDPVRRNVRLTDGPAEPYDHLILALGAVPHFAGLPGVARHAFTLKSLQDAVRLRNHVLGLLEHADTAPPGARESLLTFVVAGGGFAGTELIAELFDLVHGVLHYYPGIHPGEPRFTLLHSGTEILPELPATLGSYAARKLGARGIDIRLSTRVTAAGPGNVHLSDGAELPTHTLVWTAGNRPHPLAAEHPVDATLRSTAHPGVWAVGDCARAPDPTGRPYPPTAQHALRQGRAVADNIDRVLAGRTPQPFRFHTIGILVALGHRTAVAEIRGHRFSGLAAWLLWRGTYLAKLPGLEKRLRVLIDWIIELAFPRDIAVTSAPPDLNLPGRSVTTWTPATPSSQDTVPHPVPRPETR
ncbi:NAD(P)/FAD-dependent oxidoreductase [Rhizohabitans arisaemae]|uniref:NAD(P)/FAD-dependent oxidoreductase n=1 Tax=Rhizohabitans arisaemae TaxID=2720610 RepID=UPI0024B1EFC7|nr:NAD(P)/FAD-dependent oxidoreductase [Rhizohabitans arisaemae]